MAHLSGAYQNLRKEFDSGGKTQGIYPTDPRARYALDPGPIERTNSKILNFHSLIYLIAVCDRRNAPIAR